MTARPQVRTAWYLRCTAEEVADRAVLVGDRDRVLLAADMLDDVKILNEARGLTTATGTWHGTRLTVSAFGMGAPIAAVVLHELAALGVRTVVRLGTVLAIGDTSLGDLVLADAALRRDGTSDSYVEAGFPAAADFDLTCALRERALAAGAQLKVGLVASFDGFYTQMFADPQVPQSAATDFDELSRLGVIAADMETSAVLVIARVLGVRAGSLCLASVDALTHATLPGEERRAAERRLLGIGFDTLTILPDNQHRP